MSRQLLIDTFDPQFHISESKNPYTARDFVKAVKAGVRLHTPFESHDATAALICSVASELVHGSNPRWSGAEWLLDMIVAATKYWTAEYGVTTHDTHYYIRTPE